MCGIAGILRIHAPGQQPPPPLEAIPEHWLDILDDSIKHRGPDGQGRFRDRAVRADGHIVDVALVHRRLSILDHAGGHQPMVSVGKGQGVLTTKRATGPTWLLYESPEDPAIHAWNDNVGGLQRGVPGGRAPGLSEENNTRTKSDDLIAVAFNGCIYNHRELRRELQPLGHHFTSDHSDTEVLVHGWREWGPQVFDHTDGMYAVATWSHTAATLALARDLFGEKPLAVFSSPDDSLLAFSNTEAGLTRMWLRAQRSPLASDLVDAPSLRGWIQYGWNQTSPLLPACGDKILPGRCRLGGSGRPEVSKTDSVFLQVLSTEDSILTEQVVDSGLRASVHSRLDADAPLGTFLSGGIDSALITCFARETRPDLTAYTVRMPDASFDESAAAARTAAALGVRHEILNCSPEPTSDLISTIEQLGLPFGDSSLLPTLWVSRAARTAVRVALSGDGGDELFMGYDRHRALQLMRRLRNAPRAALSVASTVTSRVTSRPRSARADRLISAVRHTGYKELLAIFTTEHTWDLGLQPRASSGFSFDHIKHWGLTPQAAPEDTVWARRFDLCFYLPEDLLRKSDTASMACALEIRSPFLESNLASLAIDADIRSLMPNGERKGLLKQVARKYLPADIVDLPKQGFAIPIGDWFRSDFGGLRQLLRDHLLGPEPFGPDALGINAMINMNYVRQMMKEHDDAGGRSLWPWKGRDHSQRLYMLLVLSIWAKWLGGLQAPSRAS